MKSRVYVSRTADVGIFRSARKCCGRYGYSCIKGSVNYKTRCSSEHEGICGKFLPFFDRNGRIGTNMQICTHVTAAEGDDALSVAFHKEGSEVKAERVMRNDEHPHGPFGFKLLEDDVTVFSRR